MSTDAHDDHGPETEPNNTELQPPDDHVSPHAVAALQAALERLLAGRPRHTDGRLIKHNLWKEAGVSRATMNRAHRVLAEWDTRVTACDGLTPGEARKNDQLTRLRAALAERTAATTQLQRQLDAAATAIAALHHDNTLLRDELHRAGTVVPLHPHSTPNDHVPHDERR